MKIMGLGIELRHQHATSQLQVGSIATGGSTGSSTGSLLGDFHKGIIWKYSFICILINFFKFIN